MAEQEYEVDDDNKIIEGEATEVPEDDEEEESNDTSEDNDSEESDSGEDSNEREAIRARRREERHQKKEAQREREQQSRREREMLRKENEELAGRLAILERRAVGSEFAQLDQAIEQTARATHYLKEQIKLATEAGDGATVAEAMDKLYQANRHGEHLANVKRNAVSQSRQTETRSPIDPQLRQHAEGWMSKHSWYDPSGTDPDSKVALTIDQTMAEEGWDPRQSEYWTELDSRLNRYLPHRYNAKEQPTGQRDRTRSPVANSGREGTAGGGASGWKLSADRVAAMKETGAWDDPAKREAMIKLYKDYDKNQSKK
jgi:hypothetical protein